MKTLHQRLPLPLSMLAVVIALFGSTPVGQAASGAVHSVLFANNAGAVNGIKAARKPAPNKLVPLNAKGKFPASVVAQGSMQWDPALFPGTCQAMATLNIDCARLQFADIAVHGEGRLQLTMGRRPLPCRKETPCDRLRDRRE
jgi:hypothetical protein